MISSIQDYNISNTIQTKNYMFSQKSVTSSPSFKGGFIRGSIFRQGGISVRGDAQNKIIKSLNKEKLDKLMILLDKTENARTLFCDIWSCGITKNRLEAIFQCPYFLKDFKSHFKQKLIIESKWKFLMRILKQFEAYKDQLVNTGVYL